MRRTSTHLRYAQGNAPAALFAKCASVESAQAACRAARGSAVVRSFHGARRECPEDRSKRHSNLPPPLPIEDTLERFDPQSCRWLPTGDRDQPGLYRTDLYGRSIFRLKRVDQWYKVDQATGQLLVLSDRSDLLRWSRPSVDWAKPSLLGGPIVAGPTPTGRPGAWWPPAVACLHASVASACTATSHG